MFKTSLLYKNIIAWLPSWSYDQSLFHKFMPPLPFSENFALIGRSGLEPNKMFENAGYIYGPQREKMSLQTKILISEKQI